MPRDFGIALIMALLATSLPAAESDPRADHHAAPAQYSGPPSAARLRHKAREKSDHGYCAMMKAASGNDQRASPNSRSPEGAMMRRCSAAEPKDAAAR